MRLPMRKHLPLITLCVATLAVVPVIAQTTQNEQLEMGSPLSWVAQHRNHASAPLPDVAGLPISEPQELALRRVGDEIQLRRGA